MERCIFTPMPALDIESSASENGSGSREDHLRMIIHKLEQIKEQVHANITTHTLAKLKQHESWNSSGNLTQNDSVAPPSGPQAERRDLGPNEARQDQQDQPAHEAEQILEALEKMQEYDAHFKETLDFYYKALERLTGKAKPPSTSGSQIPTGPRQRAPPPRPSAGPRASSYHDTYRSPRGYDRSYHQPSRHHPHYEGRAGATAPETIRRPPSTGPYGGRRSSAGSPLSRERRPPPPPQAAPMSRRSSGAMDLDDPYTRSRHRSPARVGDRTEARSPAIAINLARSDDERASRMSSGQGYGQGHSRGEPRSMVADSQGHNQSIDIARDPRRRGRN